MVLVVPVVAIRGDRSQVEITVSELASLIDGKIVRGEPDRVLSGFASLADAHEGDLCFFNNKRYFRDLAATRAGAVLVAPGFAVADVADLEASLVEVADPTRAFSEIVLKFGPPDPSFEPGIHPTAVIADSAEFDRARVRIGPHAVIEDGVRLGDGGAIGAGTFLGAGAVIGSHCRIGPNVTIYGCCRIGDRVILHGGVVLGADGFGFEMVDGKREKVRQIGIVQIDDDVELGANTTVDRARFGRTWIKEGVKIDNQVQIGHNVVVGKHTVIAAQTGIGGSTILEDYVTCGARVGVAGHLRLGTGIFISGHSGITGDLKPHETYLGFPARPAKQMRKAMVLVRRLPLLLDRIKALEKAAGIEAAEPSDKED